MLTTNHCPGLHIGTTTIYAYAFPGETLADLHADHDPLAPIFVAMGDLVPCPLWAVLPRLAVSAGDERDTRATLLCTLLAVDSWGA